MQNDLAMKVSYLVVGIFDDGSSKEVDWFDNLQNAIHAIKESSVDDCFESFRIESYQQYFSLHCRIVDHQLFIE